MRTPTILLALALLLAVGARPATAQDGVVGTAEIEATLDARAAAEDADRAAVRRALETPEARNVADALGLDTDRLLDAAGVLDGERLATAAEHARQIESQLAGGQTFSINATTLIIILLLVIVVILIAD